MSDKRKVGTLINVDIMRILKRKAADEGRSLSDLIQDALVKYLSGGSADQEKREAAYRLFCERPFKLDQAQFREILESDAWDQ